MMTFVIVNGTWMSISSIVLYRPLRRQEDLKKQLKKLHVEILLVRNQLLFFQM